MSYNMPGLPVITSDANNAMNQSNFEDLRVTSECHMYESVPPQTIWFWFGSPLLRLQS